MAAIASQLNLLVQGHLGREESCGLADWFPVAILIQTTTSIGTLVKGRANTTKRLFSS